MKSLYPNLIFVIALALSVGSAAHANEAYPIPRYIQYGFTLKNTTGRVIDRAEFWTYAPVKKTSSQQCIDLRASHPFKRVEDKLGNQILHFTFDNLPPYATRIIRVEAELALSDEPVPLATDTALFMVPEEFIEIDDPEFQLLAPRFSTLGVTNRVEETFRWVSRNVRDEGYVRDDRGALYALKHHTGDCTEFMYLFVALCRANKIPARCMGGYVCSEDRRLKPGDYHNWAECYEDGIWRIVDPQNKVFMKTGSNYIAMKVIEESHDNSMLQFGRFRVKGSGLEVRMNK